MGWARSAAASWALVLTIAVAIAKSAPTPESAEFTDAEIMAWQLEYEDQFDPLNIYTTRYDWWRWNNVI